MHTIVDVLWLLSGGVLLYYGAEWLVKGSGRLARAFGVKPLVVGLTVVAYGTSAPELAVSSSAILKDHHALVLGAVFGSCVANLALILGVTALISPPSIDSRLIRREIPVLLLSVATVPLILLDGVISATEGALMLATAVAFTIFTLFVSAKDVGGDDDENELEEGDTIAKLSLITLIGLGGLVGGGELFVKGAKGIAEVLGMSESLVGATVVAIGTSLPELAASVVAARRGYSAMAVGNVVGSNIFNIFLILGTVALIRPIQGTIGDFSMQLGFLIGVTIIAILFMRGSRRVARSEGVVLLMAYAGFIGLLVYQALHW